MQKHVKDDRELIPCAWEGLPVCTRVQVLVLTNICSSWRPSMNRLLKSPVADTPKKTKGCLNWRPPGDWWWPNHIYFAQPRNPSKLRLFLGQLKAQLEFGAFYHNATKCCGKWRPVKFYGWSKKSSKPIPQQPGAKVTKCKYSRTDPSDHCIGQRGMAVSC